MTGNEITIVVVLGIVGYVVTTIVMNLFKKKSQASSQPTQSSSLPPATKNFPDAFGQDVNLPSSTALGSKTWYQILEINPDASIEEIERAYQRKMAPYLPQKLSGMPREFMEIANKQSKEITAAYQEGLRSNPRRF